MSLSRNLKVVRKKWKDSQSDFGARFGVSKTAVSKWEQGENEPSLRVIFELEDMTGIPARRLFREEIDPAEVGDQPGSWADTTPGKEENEIRYKVKIGELVMELDEMERRKMEVFQALEMIHGFLEQNIDPGKFRAEKEAYLDRITGILVRED